SFVHVVWHIVAARHLFGNNILTFGIGYLESNCRGGRDDSSASDEGDRERDTVTFFLGGCPSTSNLQMSALNTLSTGIIAPNTAASYTSSAAGGTPTGFGPGNTNTNSNSFTNTTTSSSGSYPSLSSYSVPAVPSGIHPTLPSSSSLYGASSAGVAFPSISREHSVGDSAQSLLGDECQVSSSSPAIIDRSVLPRGKKAPAKLPQVVPSVVGKAPMPPPRKTLSSQRQQKLHDKNSSTNSSKSDINESLLGVL
uniref:Uncharacterized protein n=1 Tax=Anopheles maculatus TaxID=74869 RepID=A0A182SWX9_9DIPT